MSRNQYINSLEKILIIPAILMIIMVVAYNASNILESRQRVVMQTNRQEFNLQALVSPYGEVTIAIDEEKKYPNLLILINGEATERFKNQYEITAKVKDKDLVQIDGSMYAEAINVVVTSVSSNISTPILEKRTTINNNIKVLWTIRIQ